MQSDNASGDPDYQQGRLEAYLSGFTDGEGTFSVAVTRRPGLEFGYQLIPEFRVSQNRERVVVLETLRSVLGCGRIVPNDRHNPSDRTMVFIIRRKADLVGRLIPFFDRNPLLSPKRESYMLFRMIVFGLMSKEHHTRSGFERLVAAAFQMNGGGRYRRTKIEQILSPQNPQRLYAGLPERG
jgi:hypothetical protein